MALQGDDFFVLRDGEKRFYTRAGVFRVDSLGRMVNPDGLIVQGKMADSLGVIGSGTAVGNITLPFGQKTAAKATSEIGFTCNLDSRESPLGSIFDSKPLLAIADGSNDMNGLYAKGNADSTLSLTPGDTVTVQIGATSDDFHTIDDLIAEMNVDFSGIITASIDSDGAINFTNGSGGDITLTITSSNATLQSSLGAKEGVSIANGRSHLSDQFSHTSMGGDLLVNLRDADGNGLEIVATDVINISGSIGGTGIGASSFTATATSTLADLVGAIKSAFNSSPPC